MGNVGTNYINFSLLEGPQHNRIAMVMGQESFI